MIGAMRPRVEVDLRAPGAAKHAESLSRGGLFVPGEELEIDAECDVLIIGAEVPVVVPARVVFADGTGIGVELVALEPAMRLYLVELASAAPADEDTVQEDGEGGGEVAEPVDEEDSGEYTVDEPVATIAPDDIEDAPYHAAIGGELGDDVPFDEGQLDPPTLDPETADPDLNETVDERSPKNVYERLRGITLVQQYKVARSGELHERVALEKIYGKQVWEQLLRNPRITAAEVARIARMGTLPRPQLEVIVSNGGWMGVPEVRRALMTNNRLSAEMIPRILRHLPKHELKLVPTQLVYTAAVRDAARKMLKAAGES
jgi:hypothetical protein